MIEIVQQESLAIGSLDAVKDFSEKDSARLLVISDSHGNSHIMQSIISSFGSMCDALCFCGDGLYDLIDTLEIAFSDNDFGKKVPPVVFFVRGNGDNSTATVFTDKRIQLTVPEFQEIQVAGRKVFLTHGHRYGVYYGLKDLRDEALSHDCDFVFYGHTHVPNSQRYSAKNDEKRILGVLNPGSCSQARGGMPNTFATVDVNREYDKCKCQYFKIVWDRNGEPVFSKLPTPRGEIRLF